MPIFLSPGFRHGSDVLLDHVPDGARDGQGHQFCTPIFDKKTFNRTFHGDHLGSVRLGFAVGLIAFEK